VPTSARTTVYPGDPVPQIHWPYWVAWQGDPAVSAFYTGGPAPRHACRCSLAFEPLRRRLGEIPLEHWVGPCWVADLTAETECGERRGPPASGIPAGTRRLLFKNP
jgi:hypothetical protein